jgi:hypothetical protein
MALIMDQAAVGKSTTASLVARVPGAATLIISNTSGVTVWVGTSQHTTTSNGVGIPTGSPPLTIPGFEAAADTTLYAIGTSTAASLGVIISTTH